jgi:uncharacterized protein GlcG (DUF336 family)
MRTRFIEPLEERRLLSTGVGPSDGAATAVSLNGIRVEAALRAPRPGARASSQASPRAIRPLAVGTDALAVADVEQILAQAASQMRPGQVIVVVDREAQVLGTFVGSGRSSGSLTDDIIRAASARARTAALFQSTQDAFTTRTARFIIQDNFPFPIRNTPGGPLYGVEFSNLTNSDIILPGQAPGISGDPGGIPLYIGRTPVGGIGVAGDLHDAAPRKDLRQFGLPGANPKGRFYKGQEESDFDEAVALAGARTFMAPRDIRATNIFVDGLRFPFTANQPARREATQTLAALVGAGRGHVAGTTTAGQPRINNATFAGIPGLLRQRTNAGLTSPQNAVVSPANNNDLIDSDDADPDRLTVADVTRAIEDAVTTARATRAGIRKPNGVPAQVHVVVVDRDGDVLGAFRMSDGTNFSYDVAVQKARTAAFFSDDDHAFSTRAVGFMAQGLFPPGIRQGVTGPLFQVQNRLNLSGTSLQPRLAGSPIANGITIFPGGVPLYKNGKLVGAVGISGDGVDQDDRAAFGGSTAFQPGRAIRSDQLGTQEIISHVVAVLQKLQAIIPAAATPERIEEARQRLTQGLDRNGLNLPYVKFPRNPER